MIDYEWGSYKGHLAHLFPKGKECVQSLCGKAYSGDMGRASPTKRGKCKLCMRMAYSND